MSHTYHYFLINLRGEFPISSGHCVRAIFSCNTTRTRSVGTNQIHTEWVCNISAAAAAKPNNFLGLIRKFLANIFPWPWPWSHLKLQIYINSVIYTWTVHNELKFIMLYYFFEIFRTEQIHRVPVRWRDKFQKCRIMGKLLLIFCIFSCLYYLQEGANRIQRPKFATI